MKILEKVVFPAQLNERNHSILLRGYNDCNFFAGSIYICLGYTDMGENIVLVGENGTICEFDSSDFEDKS